MVTIKSIKFDDHVTEKSQMCQVKSLSNTHKHNMQNVIRPEPSLFHFAACISPNFTFLFANSVFCSSTWSSFTREELMTIRGTMAADLFPIFVLQTVELLDILAKGALNFVHAVKRQRRGKCVCALLSLRRYGLRTPLPVIFLHNVTI